MNGLGKLVAAVGAVLLTATAVALPDMAKVKAPVAVQVNSESHHTAETMISVGVQPNEVAL
jgi:hypothetical protein